MNLASLVSQEKWKAFDDAWTAHMLESGDVAPVLEALRLVAEKKQLPRCLGLVREHAELLRTSDRAPEATELLGNVMLWGGNPGELADPLFDAAEAAWGSEDWWESYAALAGFERGASDMRGAWRTLDTLMSMTEDRAIYHAKGWGPGRITGLDRPGVEIEVRFASGKRDRFPLSSAIDIFEVLPHDDLRSIQVRDPEELQRLLKKEHVMVLEAVLRRFRGKVSYSVLKNALIQLGVSPTSFGAWWRKARKLAESSGWFEIAGTGAKVTVVRRYEEADPKETLVRQIRQAKDLRAATIRVRDVLSGNETAEELRVVALETLDELAGDVTAEAPHRLGAWMLLREVHGETPEALTNELAAAAAAPAPEDPHTPPELWMLLALLPGAREQERVVDLLPEVLGEDWLVEAENRLSHAPPGSIRGLLEALQEADRSDALAALYASLLARPMRNPILLVHLAELAERGEIEGQFPGPLQRAQVLLSVAAHMHASKSGNAPVMRTRIRLATLLTKDGSSVLRTLTADAGARELRTLVNITERGVESAIDSALTEIVVERHPEVFRSDDRPFWENGALWTTRAGYARRDAELRDLLDVKIPENTDAIGRAAAYGDLSENSEWEAAIEEQRNLTQRAQDIEAELREAQMIDDVTLPKGRVAPGTQVVYQELPGGDEHRVIVLGPWDTIRDDIVSYRSPLADGMLGARPGDEVTLTLPSGQLDVKVVSVAPATLDVTAEPANAS
jgi:transcription elongation factor GreA